MLQGGIIKDVGYVGYEGQETEQREIVGERPRGIWRINSTPALQGREPLMPINP